MKLPDPLNTLPEARFVKFQVPDAVVEPEEEVNVMVPVGISPVETGEIIFPVSVPVEPIPVPTIRT